MTVDLVRARRARRQREGLSVEGYTTACSQSRTFSRRPLCPQLPLYEAEGEGSNANGRPHRDLVCGGELQILTTFSSQSKSTGTLISRGVRPTRGTNAHGEIQDSEAGAVRRGLRSGACEGDEGS